MEKILSVVVPTYNMEKYLDRCLTSLILPDEQMDQLEVLVINDGSKDRSSEIAHSYEARYPQTFRVVDKENGNYGSCVNKGLALCSGKYIKILDADDWFDNSGLSQFIVFLGSASVDLVISYTRDNFSDATTKDVVFSYPPNVKCSIGQLNNGEIQRLFIHSVTFRTEILKAHSYSQLEGISYTDLQWVTEPLSFVENFSCFPKFLYNYSIGREGQTVGVDNHCKNMWMEERVIYHLADCYERNKCNMSAFQESCSKEKISALASQIYKYYLLQYQPYLSEYNLTKFDLKISELSPTIYKSLEGTTVYTRLRRFHYICNWRKNFSRKTLGFYLYDSYERLKSISCRK